MLDKNLIGVFREVGLDGKAARAYLALLELGKGTATEIAARAELKRSNVYYILDELQGKGYVHEVLGEKIKKFSATDPSKIFYAIQTATEELRFMLPVIKALQNKGKAKPRIEYFEGKDAILSVFRLYERSERKESVRYLTSIKRLKTFIPEEVTRWVARYQDKRISHRSKTLIGNAEEDKSWGREVAKTGVAIRVMPKNSHMDMDFSITETILGITSFDPLFVVVIHSEQIARSAVQLFDLAWQMGKGI